MKQKALPDLLTEHIKAELRRDERLRAEKKLWQNTTAKGYENANEPTDSAILEAAPREDGSTWDEYPA